MGAPATPTGGVPFRRLADRMQEATAASFVGRARELGEIGAALAGGAAVVVVHGAGGIGKSRLLDAVCAEHRSARRVVRLDGGDVEPTPRGFVTALAERLGCAATLEAVTGRCARSDPPVLLAVDTGERLRIIDAWLRRTFLPALPADAATVLATRDAPHRAWLGDPAWQGLLHTLALGPFSEDEAEQFLLARGWDRDAARRAHHRVRGFPLALDLLAAAPQREAPALGPDVVDELVRRVLAGLTPHEVAVAEAAAVVRRVTEPLLTALLDEPAGPGTGRRSWDALAALPFTRLAEDGLTVHETVHESIAQGMALHDPTRFAELRRRAARHLLARMGGGVALRWRTAADLLWLVRNPLVRDAFFPPSGPYSAEPAHLDDGAAIAGLMAASTPPGDPPLLRLWWERHPGAFVVTRDAAGTVVGAGAIVERAAVADDVRRLDPVVAAWEAHLRADPVPAGSAVLMARWAFGRGDPATLRPEVAPVIIDFKRSYLELHPRLHRIYTVIRGESRRAVMAGLGFAAAGPPVDPGGSADQPVVLEMGPRGVEGWLERLMEIELRTAPVAPAAGPVADTRAATLSPRETEVLRLVADGLSNREIAGRLVISEKTANRHVSAVLAKIGVGNRALATRFAVENGLTGPGRAGAEIGPLG